MPESALAPLASRLRPGFFDALLADATTAHWVQAFCMGYESHTIADIAMIVPVRTIVGDSDEERDNERESVRASMAFYGSTPNYAFIWDEAGFEGTTARIREKQKAGDFAGMVAQVTDEHVAAFATESTWDGLADALTEKYAGIATRLVLYNALGNHERFERYGEVARRLQG